MPTTWTPFSDDPPSSNIPPLSRPPSQYLINHRSSSQNTTTNAPEDIPLRDFLSDTSLLASETIDPLDVARNNETGQGGRDEKSRDNPSVQDDTVQSDIYMNRRNRSKATDPSSPSSSVEDLQNGNGSSNGAMTGTPLGHRRKYSVVLDGDSASQVAHLMSRENFSLDEQPQHPLTPADDSGGAQGFWDLPEKDRRNFLQLVLLYFLQGIPMGLAMGSVPFLLKSHLSYGQIGVFSLASYPYSLKLLWSPIIDAVWSRRIGRRKSWILPMQVISGIGMIYLGSKVEQMMIDTGASNGAGIWSFTWWWFFLVFGCATQDIAVDGWALTLISHKHIAFASTAQTVGLTGGHFLSYTVFLAFNSPDFANRWLRATPSTSGVMTLGGYLTFWGWAYIIITVGFAFLKREDKTRDREGILDVYKVMLGILKLKNIQAIFIIHLIAKIGFQANDGVTNLKLLDKGFSQEDLALTVLIDFPFELALGYYVGKWSNTYPPMQLWCWGFIGRLFAAIFAQITVMIFPAGGVTTWYLLTVIVEHVFSTFMSTVMFVAISAFHAKIADPVIGGTYMTMLGTVSNLGGTFPRIFVLKLVDYFTTATCHPPSSTPPASSLKHGASPVTSAFSCALEADKHRCIDGGGTCAVIRDGYYIMNIVCVIVGTITFLTYIRPKSLHLESLPLKAWRLAGDTR